MVIVPNGNDDKCEHVQQDHGHEVSVGYIVKIISNQIDRHITVGSIEKN